MGGAGYVGVGEVTGEVIPAIEAKVSVDGVNLPLLDQPDIPSKFRDRAYSANPDEWEMVVPVEWLATRSTNQAVPSQGLFASQATVCKLRDDHTIETLEKAFDLDG